MDKVTNIAWEKYYSDDSGIEYAVEFNANETDISNGQKGVVTFKSGCDEVTFPVREIDWIVRCLQKIESERQ